LIKHFGSIERRLNQQRVQKGTGCKPVPAQNCSFSSDIQPLIYKFMTLISSLEKDQIKQTIKNVYEKIYFESKEFKCKVGQ